MEEAIGMTMGASCKMGIKRHHLKVHGGVASPSNGTRKEIELSDDAILFFQQGSKFIGVPVCPHGEECMEQILSDPADSHLSQHGLWNEINDSPLINHPHLTFR